MHLKCTSRNTTYNVTVKSALYRETYREFNISLKAGPSLEPKAKLNSNRFQQPGSGGLMNYYTVITASIGIFWLSEIS
jgi:hypothetical protein